MRLHERVTVGHGFHHQWVYKALCRLVCTTTTLQGHQKHKDPPGRLQSSIIRTSSHLWSLQLSLWVPTRQNPPCFYPLRQKMFMYKSIYWWRLFAVSVYLSPFSVQVLWLNASVMQDCSLRQMINKITKNVKKRETERKGERELWMNWRLILSPHKQEDGPLK